MTKEKNCYLIGVDVGGTNTDSVLLDAERLGTTQGEGVLAWHKSPTTADVSDGIVEAIKQLFKGADYVGPDDIASVTIGTTHFINAVIERDRNRLVPVAVLRLCGPYSVQTPPFCDFPPTLASMLNGHTGFLNGGFKVDGALVKQVDPKEVLEHCKIIKEKGISSVVVIGNFSPLNNSHELLVRDIINKELPGVAVVMSHEVANIGFLERENASILNAAILPFAQKIVSSFETAVKSLGISAPILLTQNDGTVLPARSAARIPIRSFSSGATNSMRGAAYLCSHDKDLQNKNMIVMDIGGTTTDVGMLLANGFPRQAASYSAVGGVRMNFPMPYVESVGFGGGSIVRDGKELTIGPDSVGSDILTRSIIFGGDTTTATDVKLASCLARDDKAAFEGLPTVGLSALNSFDSSLVEKFEAKAQEVLEAALDRIKTSPDPIPVLLVGGGSILAPTSLSGASKVIKPKFFGIANAIGAAISKVSAVIDYIGETSEALPISEVKRTSCERAIAAAITNGARSDTVSIAELDCIPLPYVANRVRIVVKAVGDLDVQRLQAETASNTDVELDTNLLKGGKILKNAAIDGNDTSVIEDGTSNMASVDVEGYRPMINSDREWIISIVDIEFLALGAYILGAGGGGNPYPVYLRIRELIKAGKTLKVVDIQELADKNKQLGIDPLCPVCGGAGSPTVSVEQIQGQEMERAYELFIKYLVQSDDRPQAIMSLEIGGGNGLESMKLAGSHGTLCVDADLMGRAYPTLWQTTPLIYSDDCVLGPAAFSDGNGNEGIITGAESHLVLEKMIRATLSQIGSRVGVVNGLISVSDMVEWSIPKSTSLAWRLGRAVFLARQKNMVDQVSSFIVEAAGGEKSAREIFRGKIIEVERRLEGGYSFGEVVIQSITETKNGKPLKLNIPFKNENISAELFDPETGEKKRIATVPDLICVMDTQNGANIGNPDFRYGLQVFVILIACSPKWKTTKGMEIGGPKGFDLSYEYVDAGVEYVEPRSVISEYA